MGLSRTISELNGDFNRKSQTFPTPVYYHAHAEWISLGMGNSEWLQETRVMWLSSRERSLTSLAVWIQYTNVTDRRTDIQTERRTPVDSKYRAYAYRRAGKCTYYSSLLILERYYVYTYF